MKYMVKTLLQLRFMCFPSFE